MYLGIDVGTTATKAILVDGDQRTIASASATYDLRPSTGGESEMDPSLWTEAARSVLAQLARSASQQLAATRAISLSGQMHSVVLLDGGGHPVRPAILWSDERGEEEGRVPLFIRRSVPRARRAARAR